MDWTKTYSMVLKLEQILVCPLCDKLLNEPANITMCEHYFCRECVLSVMCDNGDSSCPICCLPSWVKDVHPNYQMSNLIGVLTSLKSLLESVMSSPTLSKRWCDSSLRRFEYDEKLTIIADNDGGRIVDTPLTVDEDGCCSRVAIRPMRSCNKINIPAKRQKHDAVESSMMVKRNTRGETPLHVASLKGDKELVKRLLQLGADPNTQDNAKWTPLHEACHAGYMDIVQLLVDNGAIVNIPGYHNNTPLHDAVENNHIDIVKFLQTNGADNTIRNCLGLTANEVVLSHAMKDVLATPVNTVNLLKPVCATRKTINIVTTGLKPDQRDLLTKVVKSLGGKISEQFSREVTHVVTACDENMNCIRTMKSLCAVATGKWLLDYQWIISCSSENVWSDEEIYEVKGFAVCKGNIISDGPRKARQAIMIKKFPGLFEGCEIYLTGLYNSPLPNKDSMTNLILLSHGKILTREPKIVKDGATIYPFHALPESVFSSRNVIIVHATCMNDIRNSNIIHKPVTWLLDSISYFKLLK